MMQSEQNGKKVWNKNKLTAIVIIIIAIVAVFCIYISLDKPAINHPKSLEKSISSYIFTADVQAEVIQVEQYGQYLMVTFTDKRYPSFMGLTQFRKGADFLWHPYHTSYGNELTIASYQYGERGENVIAVYGIDADSRIASYEGWSYEQVVSDDGLIDQEILYKNNVTDRNFIDYYGRSPDIPFIYGIRFYDSEGNDITKELKTEQDDTGPNGTVSSLGNSKFGNWGIYFSLLFIALIIARFFWATDPKPLRYTVSKEDHLENTGRKNESLNAADKLK